MKESIKTIVLTGEKEIELELELEPDEDIFRIFVDGEELFYGDWERNLKPFFERALELWK